MKPISDKVLFLGGGVLIGLLAVIWIIAGSDRLFQRTVPIQQRLVSHNEAIRTKAQQELLGFGADAKREVAGHLVASITQEDPFLSKWAAIALALIGPNAQDALPSLLQCVSFPEKEVAQACRVAISEIGVPDPQQLPNLIEALGDARAPVRCEAATSISKMGPAARDAWPVLLRELQTNNTLPDCVMAAASSLVGSLPEVAPTLFGMLSDPSETARLHAAEILATVGVKSPEEIQVLFQTLADDPSGDVRRFAAKALALKQAPDRGLLAVLGYAFRRSRLEPVRLAALENLRQQKVPLSSIQTLLIGGLEDDAPAVRLQVIRWIRDLDLEGRFAIEALVPHLRDPDLAVRRLVIDTLRRSAGRKRELLTPIARAQRDSDPGVRCLAAETLVEMGAWDRVAIPLLIADMRNAALDEFHCPADALGMAGLFNPDVPPALVKLLQESDREIRRRAVHAVMVLGSKGREALPALTQAQKDQIPGAENAIRAIRDALPRPRRHR